MLLSNILKTNKPIIKYITILTDKELYNLIINIWALYVSQYYYIAIYSSSKNLLSNIYKLCYFINAKFNNPYKDYDFSDKDLITYINTFYKNVIKSNYSFYNQVMAYYDKIDKKTGKAEPKPININIDKYNIKELIKDPYIFLKKYKIYDNQDSIIKIYNIITKLKFYKKANNKTIDIIKPSILNYDIQELAQGELIQELEKQKEIAKRYKKEMRKYKDAFMFLERLEQIQAFYKDKPKQAQERIDHFMQAYEQEQEKKEYIKQIKLLEKNSRKKQRAIQTNKEPYKID